MRGVFFRRIALALLASVATVQTTAVGSASACSTVPTLVYAITGSVVGIEGDVVTYKVVSVGPWYGGETTETDLAFDAGRDGLPGAGETASVTYKSGEGALLEIGGDYRFAVRVPTDVAGAKRNAFWSSIEPAPSGDVLACGSISPAETVHLDGSIVNRSAPGKDLGQPSVLVPAAVASAVIVAVGALLLWARRRRGGASAGEVSDA